MTVPEGTVQDVLDWVGDDPGRAQEALDAERVGQQRSTLISQLEAICPREDRTVTDTATATSADERLPAEGDEEALAPGPEQPVDVIIDPAAEGTAVGPVHVRDADVEVEDVALNEDPEVDAEESIPESIQVETMQAAGSHAGLLLVLNGQAFAFNDQMVATLKQVCDKAVAGLVL
jgi:hypothetical protein